MMQSATNHRATGFPPFPPFLPFARPVMEPVRAAAGR
jgi:hypothetical protein